MSTPESGIVYLTFMKCELLGNWTEKNHDSSDDGLDPTVKHYVASDARCELMIYVSDKIAQRLEFGEKAEIVIRGSTLEYNVSDLTNLQFGEHESFSMGCVIMADTTDIQRDMTLPESAHIENHIGILEIMRHVPNRDLFEYILRVVDKRDLEVFHEMKRQKITWGVAAVHMKREIERKGWHAQISEDTPKEVYRRFFKSESGQEIKDKIMEKIDKCTSYHLFAKEIQDDMFNLDIANNIRDYLHPQY